METVIIVYDKSQEGRIPNIITDNVLLKGDEVKMGNYIVEFKEEIQNKKLIDVFSCVTYQKYKQYETMHNIEVKEIALNYSLDDPIHKSLF